MEIGRNPLDAIRDPSLKFFYERVLAAPAAERRSLLRAEGNRAVEDFPKKLRELEQVLLASNPFHTLARFCFYDLGYLPEQRKKLITTDPIELYQIELIQALLLRHATEEYKKVGQSAEQFQKVRDLLREATSLFAMKGLSRVKENDSENTKEYLLGQIRTHTSAVRGWAPEREMLATLKQLFAPIDLKIKTTLGFGILDVITLFEGITSLTEERRNAHFLNQKQVMCGQTISEMLKAFAAMCPFPQFTQSVRRQVALRCHSLEKARIYLWESMDQLLIRLFKFSLDDLVRVTNGRISNDSALKLASKLSYCMGELRGRNQEHFFLDNPIWRKPFISVAKNLWWMPITSLFHCFGFEIIEELLTEEKSLTELFHQRKAIFLEEAIGTSLAKRFPEAQIFYGSQYSFDSTGQVFENDILVIEDSIGFIIEAKAGNVNAVARRGGSSIEEEIQKLVVAPSIQAAQFAKFLERNPGIHHFKSTRGPANHVDTRNLHKVVNFTVTLERLGPLVVQLGELQRSGLAKYHDAILPSMSLADLQLLVELLNPEFEFFHYFTRRAAFCEKRDVLADELDLLVFYLETGFVDLPNDQIPERVMMYGLSQQLDHYLHFRGTDLAGNRPRRRMSDWWIRILEEMERKKLYRRYELGALFLDVRFDQQVAYEKQVKRVIRKFRKQKRVQTNEFRATTLLAVSDVTSTTFIAVPVRREHYDERKNIVENFARDAFNVSASQQVVVILLDVDGGHWPYSGLYLYARD